MAHYLGSALRAQKLKHNQLRQHILELLGSFLLGTLIGLCFGMEYVVKFFN